MSEFTKRPIPVQAVQIKKKIRIQTREGTLYGYPGEWLITGIQGEKYPCKDDIFRDTYKPTGEDKCQYCKFGEDDRRPCDMWEVCCFEWKPEVPA